MASSSWTEEPLLLLSLPDELLAHILQTLYAPIAAQALERVVCYPSSADEVRSARRRLRRLRLTMAIGAVCRRFRSFHWARPGMWICCSRAMFCYDAFSHLRQLLEQPSIREVFSVVDDDDFTWVGGYGRTRDLNVLTTLDSSRGHHAFQAGPTPETAEARMRMIVTLDGRLASLATRGRFAAWQRATEEQHIWLKRCKRLLLQELRRLLLVLRGTPQWVDAQLVLAVWFASLLSIDELLCGDGSQDSWAQLAELWDSVHNGVCNGVGILNIDEHWADMIETRSTQGIRCTRVWKRVKAELQSRDSPELRMFFPLAWT